MRYNIVLKMNNLIFIVIRNHIKFKLIIMFYFPGVHAADYHRIG